MTSTALVVVVACLPLVHALSWASVRPLYQVSDEINYAFSVQHVASALVTSEAQRACVAPPDGALLPLVPVGKAGYSVATGHALAWLCGNGGAFPLLALRSLHAVSLPIIALCTWQMTWLLTRRRVTAFVAAMIVALHPVAATHAGAITPDAWANAWSATALLVGTRILLGHRRWWDWPVLVVCSLVALAWKDTAHFLVVHLVLVLGAAVVGTSWRTAASPRRWTRQSRVVAGGAAALAVLAGITGRDLLVSPYLTSYDVSHASAAPLALARAVIDDALVQSPGMLLTSVVTIGGFGASSLTMPTAPALWLLCTAALALVGVLRHVVSPRSPWLPGTGVVLLVWLVAGLACALQPSIRQALLQTTDVHQGRWLLPMLAPAATAAALGLTTLLRSAMVPGVVLVWSGAALVTLSAAVGHFYEAFPSHLDRSALFLRSTGGQVIDDDRVLRVIESTHAAQGVTLAWCILMAMVAGCGSAVWQAHNVARSDDRNSGKPRGH